MGFLDFLKAWFGSKEEPKNEVNQKHESSKENKEMKTKKSTVNDDKSFHPEILFLINRPYAEYVDFEEI